MLQFVKASPAAAIELETAMMSEDNAASPFRLDLSAFLKSCLAHKKILFFAPLLTAAIALGLVSLMRPSYVATAEILVDPANLSLVQNDIAPSVQQGDAGAANLESQVKVMTSGNVLQRVVKKLNLTQDPDFFKTASISSALSKLWPSRERAHSAEDEVFLAVLDTLRKNITVRRPERTYILDISVKDVSPERAAKIANALTQAYLEERTAAASEAAKRATASLVARLDELRESVQAATTKLEKFREKNNLVRVNGRLMTDYELNDLIVQLDQAKDKTRKAKIRLDQIKAFVQNPSDKSLPEVTESPEVQALRAQLNALLRNEADLSSQFGPRHPAISAIRSQIEAVRIQIEREAGRVISTIRSATARSLAEEELVQKQINALKAMIAQNTESMVTQGELERQAEAQRAIYESFLRRSQEASEQVGIDKNNIRIITPATTPTKRAWPPPLSTVLIGSLGLGILGALAAVFWLSGQAKPLREQDAPDMPVTPAPLAASTPAPMPEPAPILHEQGEASPPPSPDGLSAPLALMTQRSLLPNNRPDQISLFSNAASLPLDTLIAPDTPFAQDVEKIFLQLNALDDNACKIILATGAADGADIAAVAVNLAMVEGKNSGDVLLVEMDPSYALIKGLGLKAPIGSDKPLSIEARDRATGVILGVAPQTLMLGQSLELWRQFEQGLEDYSAIVIHAGPILSAHVVLLGDLCDQIVFIGASDRWTNAQARAQEEEIIARGLQGAERKIAVKSAFAAPIAQWAASAP